MAEFNAGEQKTALVTFTNNKAKALNCEAQLYMGDNYTLMASKTFELTAHGSSTVQLPVTMPTTPGDYPVYLAAFSNGVLLPPIAEAGIVTILLADVELISSNWTVIGTFYEGSLIINSTQSQTVTVSIENDQSYISAVRFMTEQEFQDLIVWLQSEYDRCAASGFTSAATLYANRIQIALAWPKYGSFRLDAQWNDTANELSKVATPVTSKERTVTLSPGDNLVKMAFMLVQWTFIDSPLTIRITGPNEEFVTTVTLPGDMTDIAIPTNVVIPNVPYGGNCNLSLKVTVQTVCASQIAYIQFFVDLSSLGRTYGGPKWGQYLDGAGTWILDQFTEIPTIYYLTDRDRKYRQNPQKIPRGTYPVIEEIEIYRGRISYDEYGRMEVTYYDREFRAEAKHKETIGYLTII